MGRNGRFRSRTSPLERDGHGPRPDHDLLCDHARHGWRFWQLVRTHHERGACHGLPPNEQHFLLVTRTGISPVYRLDYRARMIRLGRRDRLAALSAAFNERIAWPSCRHGDTFNAPGGSIFHPWGHQFHHHHLEHARPWHYAPPTSPFRLGHSGDTLQSV